MLTRNRNLSVKMKNIYLFHNINPKPKNVWEVRPEDLMEIINEIKIGELDDTEIHFDDARVGVYDYAFRLLRELTPILKVVIFVPTRWIDGHAPKEERYSEFMTWEQLRELKDEGFEIGSHTITHSNLTLLDKTSLKAELRHSKRTIKKKLNLSTLTKFSYPYGAYTKQVVCAVQKTYCFAYCLGNPDFEKHNMIPIGKYKDYLIPRTTIISKKP